MMKNIQMVQYGGNVATVLLMFVFAFALQPVSASEVGDIQCKEEDLCRQTSTGLPLRGLPRPYSKMYAKPSTGSDIVASGVRAFYPLYVFERKDVDFSDPAKPKGWYRLGPSIDDPIGWMQAKDILEWKQALVVAYTHHGTGKDKRKQVVMFDAKDGIADLVEAEDREARAEELYQGIASDPIRAPDGLVTMEPARFVDIEEKFYLLPVIDFEEVDIFDDETKYLQVAAAIPRDRADGGDTVQSEEYVEQATADQGTQGTQAKDLGVDIKFVLDISGSMDPYVNQTKRAIQRLATEISGDSDTVAFGLVGFRDDVKNFTPTLVDAKGFDAAISGVSVGGGGDNQEEVFAGVKEAIESTWSHNSLKVVIVVGDQSSHEHNHPLSLTGMSAKEIRSLATTQGVKIVVMHLKGSRNASDHPLAEAQFRILGQNPGAQLSGYMPINADDKPAFGQAVKKMAKTMSALVSDIRRGDTSIVKKTFLDDAGDGSAKATIERAGEVAASIIASSTVVYVGKAATPPRDVTAWLVDRDLVDPTTRSMDVRVLLSKRELNDLIIALEQVVQAVKRSKLTSMQFFDALQGVVATSAKGEKVDFERARDLAGTGLMPDWIGSLPYKSVILSLTPKVFEELSPDERANLEGRIERLLKLYRELNNNTDVWVALNEEGVDAEDDRVYPISLENLP
uniref:von Willebrand factor type A domain-containing protein n=1 Tax=Candidatus Kentrum sp. UNK TaxID=2126344 RepID=A0A451AIV5_9GAMM|nr:MAG: von Willebrand factor type A domain-containing protein [Candidatus Kentron sp. UNK]VFK70609.1 MAG: von Willebrand factor type A domain-containing protein [Candidatus Kentron sp. UNK]